MHHSKIKQCIRHVMMIIPGYVNQETGKLVVKLPHNENNDCVSAWVGHSLSPFDSEGRQNEFAKLAFFFNARMPRKPVS